ncbi:MAG TPA: GNAT family N-acetyltransferase [Steroidobacteraceae bacterium]|nr:GNAT family N-acetyltransferase [Steroidobacteraceae bacterium]HJY42853.1 GNAT family N-acetyltransferase [Steroidobacteraceae bacterium]
MSPSIHVRSGDAPELEALLAQRIYEYNAAATGRDDGESFSAARTNATGDVEAGVYGWTWCDCCYVTYLWVAESIRGTGVGTELLDAVERHAREKCCSLVLLASHSFQAPAFYARKGYEQVARIEDHPVGHSSIFFAKRI